MPKTLTRLTLAALAASLCVTAAATAQTTLEWIVLAPAGEKFTARMPQQPTPSDESVEAGGLKAAGRRYAASAADGTTFAVWVMKGSHGSTRLDAATPRGATPHLDAVAELAWEVLLTPEVERLKRGRPWFKRLDEIDHGMRYAREFEVSGRPAREYQVWLEKARGAVYVVTDESGAYVVAALGPRAGEQAVRPFLDSFALQSATPSPRPGRPGGLNVPPGAGVGPGSGTGTGVGLGTGTGKVEYGGMSVGGGAAVDYSRPFRQNEVTKKAVLTRKPEPGFTEQARRFWVTGTVRLRAILWAGGEVRQIAVVRGLPHGLTQKAIAAARAIKFEPAQKGGRPVSQYVVLEYHFNIY
ncbi:MAG: TonB family protein [Acidobacteria bacterium]|nr:TonB family protein [Acidobacteriota bacterium]